MEKKYEDLLNWWLNINPLTPEEEKIVFKSNDNPPILKNNYEILEQQLIDRMLFSNISTKTHKLELGDSATTLINKLFDYYVDDETLVIYSNHEHGAVVECINKCKNRFTIDIDNYQLYNLCSTLSKYKKIFVYIIGTNISTGKITPQIIYNKIREAANSLGIKSIIVCDDVHGIYITPRDYSFFDYVITTYHALNKHYDMGMLISRKENPIMGIQASNWLEECLASLDIILKRRDKLNLFYKVMGIVFEKYIIRPDFELVSNVTPNIFSLKMKKMPIKEEIYKELRKYHVYLDGYDTEDSPYYYIRIRGQQFITHPQYLICAMKVITKYLDTIVYCWDNFN